MKRTFQIISASILLVLCGSVLLRKHDVPIISNGRVVAVAKQPFLPVLDDGAVDIYAGREKIFSLWEDAFDFPIFIYPFADGQRFLCDYDYDTADLVFVIGLSNSSKEEPPFSKWPVDEDLRAYLAQSATNVVLETKGHVRLPNCAELQEVCDYLAHITQQELEKTSLPFRDFGIYRTYPQKEDLQCDVATNRQTYWPLRN